MTLTHSVPGDHHPLCPRGPSPTLPPGTLTHSRLSAGIVWKLSCISVQQDGLRLGAGEGVRPLLTTIKLDFSRGQRQESRGQRQRFPRVPLPCLRNSQNSVLRSNLKVLVCGQKGPGLNYPGSTRAALWGGKTCPSGGFVSVTFTHRKKPGAAQSQIGPRLKTAPKIDGGFFPTPGSPISVPAKNC